MKSPKLTRGRILFWSSFAVGLTLLTYNLIRDIFAGVPISISEQIIRYSALFGILLVAWQTKVLWFRKLIGFGLGIIAICLMILVLLGGGPWQWIELACAGVFCYGCFVLAISPDVAAYLKKGATPKLTRGRILFLSSIVVGLTLLTYNLIREILAGVPISISEKFFFYIAYIGVWILASQIKVFRKLIGFGLGIIAIVWIIAVLLGAGPWQGSDLDSVGVFCYIFFVFAISPDVDAYLKKGPNKAINSDS